ncbi:uncharacterized protein NG2371_03525 [Nocardia gamkensis]|nr:uncharacterized protein [Nocardia gamkensis]
MAVGVLSLGGASLLIGLLLMTQTLAAIVAPINGVRRAMREVEKGEFDLELAVYDGTERGELQSGFNNMVGGLREREEIRDVFGRHGGREVANAALTGKAVALPSVLMATTHNHLVAQRSALIPRVQGAPRPRWTPAPFRGLIPADAGAHRFALARSAGPGSSPAGAGSTTPSSTTASTSRDHPRGRGSTNRHGQQVDFAGVIPAGAGSTSDLITAGVQLGAHPCGRGEHFSLPALKIRSTGSSPQARGAHLLTSDFLAGWVRFNT